MMGRPFEEASRLPEYAGVRAAGGSDLKAGMASQDISGNFQETGYWSAVRGIQMMAPFLRPGLQGTRRTVELVRDNPKETLGVAMITSAVPSFLLWMASKDDVEIQDMRRSKGGHNWYYLRLLGSDPDEPGEIIRWPKDFVWQRTLGTLTEALLDMTYLKDPDAIKDWAVRGLREFGGNAMPVPATAALGISSGKDPYFGTPLASPETQDLPPYMRGTDYTGPTARRLAEGASRVLEGVDPEVPVLGKLREHITPGNIEYAVRATTGSAGSDVLKAADFVLDLVQSGDDVDKVSQPARSLSENPFLLGLFARQASTSTAPVRKFYERYNRIQEVRRGIEADEKVGDRASTERATSVRNRHVEDLATIGMMEYYHEAMSLERKRIEDILRTPDRLLSRERKAEDRMESVREIQRLAREAQAELRKIPKGNK